MMAAYSKYGEEVLTELLVQGDRLAFTEIYRRYKAPLYLFACKRLEQREEARDVVHDLFMSIWDRHETLYIATGLGPYLYTAVRNRIMDIFAHQDVASRYVDHFQQYVDTAEAATDHLVRQRNLEQLIEREIAALPTKMRQVFEMSRRSGLSRQEIAGELNISEETVKSHMHHALKLLKTKLGPLFVILLILY